MNSTFSKTIAPEGDCGPTNDVIFQFKNDLSNFSESETQEENSVLVDEAKCAEQGGVWCDEGCHESGYTGCQCPQKDGRYGIIGKVSGTCCLDGYLAKWGSYDSLDIASCGCPRDDNGLGHLGTDNQTCCNAKNYAFKNNQYASYDPACGCPDGGELKGSDGNLICCKETNSWIGGGYNGNDSRCVEVIVGGCPDSELYGPVYVGNDGVTCCNSAGQTSNGYGYLGWHAAVCQKGSTWPY